MSRPSRSIEIRDIRERQFFWLDNSFADEFSHKLTHSAVVLYMLLCRYSNSEQQCWPSQKALSEKLNCKVETIRLATKQLRESNLILTEQVGEGRFSKIIYTLRRIPKPTGGLEPESPNESATESPNESVLNPPARALLTKPIEQNLINNTREEASFAAGYVLDKLSWTGKNARWAYEDQIFKASKTNCKSAMEWAELMVERWQEYDAKEIPFKRGIEKFIETGLWNQPEKWERVNGKGKGKISRVCDAYEASLGELER